MLDQEIHRLKLELGIESCVTSADQAEVDEMVFYFSVVYDLLSAMKLEESGSGNDTVTQTHVELLLHDVYEYGMRKHWTVDQTFRLLVCAMQICVKTENTLLLVQFLRMFSQNKSNFMLAISTPHSLYSPTKHTKL